MMGQRTHFLELIVYYQMCLWDFYDKHNTSTVQPLLHYLHLQEMAGYVKTALARRGYHQAAGAEDADIVIEAVYEQFESKREVFEELGRICASDVVLASNTSSIPITRLAAATQHPARVVGMHFMNPVPRMKLVEVIRGLLTSASTIEKTKALALSLEKVPIEVRDSPGFVTNRVLIPMINEAVFSLMEGVADAEAIDQVLKLGMNHPMGPLELADLIGLDICLDIMEVLYDSFKDTKYRPCPLLRQMVDGGWLGRKSGRGFYSYAS